MELRFADTCQQSVAPDVELVVPERGPVETDGVQHVDHLPARQWLSVDDRGAEGGRSDEIAGEVRQQSGELRLQARAHGGEPGESANLPRLHRRNLVDVVEMKDGDRRGTCR
jgi:hypothetical protein